MAMLCPKCWLVMELKHKCKKQKSIEQISKEIHKYVLNLLKNKEKSEKRKSLKIKC